MQQSFVKCLHGNKFHFHQSQQEFSLASSAVEYEDPDASDIQFRQLG